MQKTEEEKLSCRMINIASNQEAFSKTISSAPRKRQMYLHNRRTKLHNFNFHKGYFVLVSHSQPDGQKVGLFRAVT